MVYNVHSLKSHDILPVQTIITTTLRAEIGCQREKHTDEVVAGAQLPVQGN